MVCLLCLIMKIYTYSIGLIYFRLNQCFKKFLKFEKKFFIKNDFSLIEASKYHFTFPRIWFTVTWYILYNILTPWMAYKTRVCLTEFIFKSIQLNKLIMNSHILSMFLSSWSNGFKYDFFKLHSTTIAIWKECLNIGIYMEDNTTTAQFFSKGYTHFLQGHK